MRFIHCSSTNLVTLKSSADVIFSQIVATRKASEMLVGMKLSECRLTECVLGFKSLRSKASSSCRTFCWPCHIPRTVTVGNKRILLKMRASMNKGFRWMCICPNHTYICFFQLVFPVEFKPNEIKNIPRFYSAGKNIRRPDR